MRQRKKTDPRLKSWSSGSWGKTMTDWNRSPNCETSPREIPPSTLYPCQCHMAQCFCYTVSYSPFGEGGHGWRAKPFGWVGWSTVPICHLLVLGWCASECCPCSTTDPAGTSKMLLYWKSWHLPSLAGNGVGWKPKDTINGDIPRVELIREFCAHSAQGRIGLGTCDRTQVLVCLLFLRMVP